MQCGHDFLDGEICDYCKDDPPNFKSLKSWAIYEGPLRKAILRLKYSGDISLAETLSVPMIELLNGTDWKLDAVAPVPISEKRSEDRGYNQAALLAFPISLKTGIPYRKNALKKVRENRSQVGLTFDERYKNVIDAFICGDDFIIDKAVLVVDDVVTSGATMNECAKVLLDKGAREVYGITLARAGIQ